MGSQENVRCLSKEEMGACPLHPLASLETPRTQPMLSSSSGMHVAAAYALL